MKKIYKFYWDCGRQGSISGIFSAEESYVKECIGKRVNFGEALGKHSQVYGTLEEKDLTVLTDDAEFIKKAEEFELVPTGANPLSNLPECE